MFLYFGHRLFSHNFLHVAASGLPVLIGTSDAPVQLCTQISPGATGGRGGIPQFRYPAGKEDRGGMINGIGGLPRGLAGLNESAVITIFADYQQLGTYMSGLSSHLETMLDNIKSSADLTMCVVTLQELSKLLSISTEDTLVGSFQVDTFVRKLVKILGDTGNTADDDNGDDNDDSHEQGEDAQLAAALTLSRGWPVSGRRQPRGSGPRCSQKRHSKETHSRVDYRFAKWKRDMQYWFIQDSLRNENLLSPVTDNLVRAPCSVPPIR